MCAPVFNGTGLQSLSLLRRQLPLHKGACPPGCRLSLIRHFLTEMPPSPPGRLFHISAFCGTAGFIGNAVGAHLCVRPLLMGRGYNPSVLPFGLFVIPHPSFPYGNATFPSGKAFPYFRLLWNGGFYWKRCRGDPCGRPFLMEQGYNPSVCFADSSLYTREPALRVIGYPSSVFFAEGEKSTYTLAVPKIFFGIRLEYFDRGAKPCSLHRPQDALHRLCSKGRLFPPFRLLPKAKDTSPNRGGKFLGRL